MFVAIQPREPTFEDYVAGIPAHRLDRELDFDHDDVDVDLGAIAGPMLDWELLAPALSLTDVDISDIHSNNSRQPVLQRREALQKWKGRFGFQATYGALLRIFLAHKDLKSSHKCALKIREVLGATGPVTAVGSVHVDTTPQGAVTAVDTTPLALGQARLPGAESATLPGANQTISDQVPKAHKFTMKNIKAILVDLAPKKVVDLAVELDLSKNEVERIEMEHPKDMNRVLIEVIDMWLKNITNPEPSWEVLREALKRVQPGLAGKVPSGKASKSPSLAPHTYPQPSPLQHNTQSVQSGANQGYGAQWNHPPPQGYPQHGPPTQREGYPPPPQGYPQHGPPTQREDYPPPPQGYPQHGPPPQREGYPSPPQSYPQHYPRRPPPPQWEGYASLPQGYHQQNYATPYHSGAEMNQFYGQPPASANPSYGGAGVYKPPGNAPHPYGHMTYHHHQNGGSLGGAAVTNGTSQRTPGSAHVQREANSVAAGAATDGGRAVSERQTQAKREESLQRLANIDSSTILVTRNISHVSKLVKDLTPAQARELGIELGLSYSSLSKKPNETLHLDLAQMWILGHDASRSVCGQPTWRALALGCAKQELWGLVEAIERKYPNSDGGVSNVGTGSRVEHVQSTSPSLLGIDDKRAVLSEVGRVASLWEDFGLALDLKQDTLDQVRSDNADSSSRLSAVISEWLRGNGGERTWKYLADALRDPLVGRPDLADRVAAKHL